MPRPSTLTSAEAASALGVKRTTLYSYVSRGLVGTVAGPDGRSRRYLTADIDALRVRAAAHKGHHAAAASATDWGAPVLDSSITSIDADGPNYRGHPALSLAEQGVPFESVATLLWTGVLPSEAPSFTTSDLGLPMRSLSALLPDQLDPLTLLSAVVPMWAAHAPHRHAVAPRAAHQAGTLLRRMAAVLAWSGPAEGRAGRCRRALRAPTLAQALVAALGANGVAAPLVNAALVLCADHELNASTFAARVAAGTHADDYAIVQAALATLSGPRHGRASDRVEGVLDQAAAAPDLRRWLEARYQHGEPVPGFGHRLYPHGDPRGEHLLTVTPAPTSGRAKALRELVHHMQALGHPAPNIDVGLVAARLSAGLPRGSVTAVFALGRTAGWIAHGREQRANGAMIRPRARYVGV